MDEEEDEILNEMPVYLSQVLTDQLYLFQYPVQPSTRDFSKANVINSKVKPKHQEVLLELALDTTSDHYDISKGEQIALNTDGMPQNLSREPNSSSAYFKSGVMDKQCYSSSGTINREEIHKYAAAYIQDGELHCTPLTAIVQMRPSFFYFDKFDKRTKAEQKAENEADMEEEEIKQVTVKFARAESEKVRKAREKSYGYLSKKSEEEPWCDTMYYHKSSNEAELERMRLLCPNSNDISHSLSLTKHGYLQTLVPPEIVDGEILPSLPSHVLSLNSLKTLPLIEQCKLLLKDAKLITFQYLSLILAQETLTTDKLLKALPQVGLLIHGCWTARSEVLYPQGSLSGNSGVPADLMCRGRDYVLYLFTENQYVDRRKVSSIVKLPPEEVKEILSSVARLRYGKGWELLLPPDAAFEQKHQDIVQRQALFWQAKQRQFAEMLNACNNVGGAKRQRKRSQRESISLEETLAASHINGADESVTKCNGIVSKNNIKDCMSSESESGKKLKVRKVKCK